MPTSRSQSNLLQARTLRIGAGLICGILAALVAHWVLTPQWEATGLVEIGRVGGPNGQIESVVTLVARMRALSTVNAVALASGLDTSMDSTSKLIAGTRLQAAGDYLELRVRSPDPARAVRIANAYVDEVVRQHKTLEATAVEGLASQARDLEARIAANRKEVLATMNGAHLTDAEIVVLAQGQASRVVFEQQDMDLIRQLSPPNTTPTRLVVPIAVSSAPVFPSLSILIGLGIATGLAVSLSLIFGRRILGLSHPDD